MKKMNNHIQIVLTVLILLTGCSGKMPKLGVENGQLMPCPTTPNCVNSQAKGQKNHIEPIRIMGKSQEAKSRILKIISEWDRCQIIVADDYYIKAEFTSSVFRFVDDVEFYFPDTKSKETIIHVRSASRVGIIDFGVNRKRIEKIRREIDAISNNERK
ncbi:MAG: DUF1499 domain-containing protein [Desulfobacterales bacterium]|nr:DUF1499 domain-containing protein [Desulfobacterales bacterium]